jgi:hypothetical protein
MTSVSRLAVGVKRESKQLATTDQIGAGGYIPENGRRWTAALINSRLVKNPKFLEMLLIY